MGKTKRIDPKRFYSLGEIVREEIIPGIDSVPKASRLVRNPYLTKVLNAQVVAESPHAISYKVRGSNIIKYLIMIEDNG